jgi:acyl dehydratase
MVQTADKLKQFVADSKALVGKEATDILQGIRVVDYTAIRRMASALGYVNPLWNNVAQDVGTIYNTMIAPPALVLSIRTPDSGANWEKKEYGLRRFTTKASIEWNDVLRLGERVTSSLKVTAVREGKKWGARDTAEVDSEATYSVLNGPVVGKATGTTVMVPYNIGEPLIDDHDIHVYTPEQIKKLETDLDAASSEKPRGRVPRYWSQVSEGEKLPQAVKGPVSYNELTAWRTAEAKPFTAQIGVVNHHFVEERPGRRVTNPSTDWPVFDVEQAYNDLLSVAALGFKKPVTRGLMRVALATQLVTNWMGDLGFLRRITAEMPNHFCYEDTMWLNGQVSSKHKVKEGKEDYFAVDIKITGKNQRDEPLLNATATVYLPEKGFLVGLPIGNAWW